MKTKKSLKFSKETVILLNNTAKKSLNGGNNLFNATGSTPPLCITGGNSCWLQCINNEE